MYSLACGLTVLFYNATTALYYAQLHDHNYPTNTTHRSIMKLIAAIFDMDGLLIDSERPALAAFQAACNHFGMGDNFALYKQLLGTNQATTREILGKSLEAHIDREEFLSVFETLYHDSTKDGVPLMKGVINLLDFLDRREIPVAVATSTNSEKAIEKLETSGILHRFETVTGGDQVSNGKPAPDIYLKSAQSLNVQSSNCIALEDSPNGIKSAVSAGMHAIQIPQLVQPDEKLLSLGHQVFTDLDEATNYLERLQALG